MRAKVSLTISILLLICIGAYWGLHSPTSSNPGVSPAALEPEAANAPSDSELISSEIDAERSGPSPAVPESLNPESPDRTPAPRVKFTGAILKGEVQAKAAKSPTEFTIRVRVQDQEEVLTRIGAGPFELRLDKFSGNSDLRELSILAIVTGDGYVPSSAYARYIEPNQESTATLAQYEVVLMPSLVERVITGKLLAQNGAPLESPWVTFLPDQLKQPPTFERIAFTRTDEDGNFELRITHSLSGKLIGYEANHGVLHVPIEDTLQTLIELGDLPLPLGASITGHAFRDGNALGVGARVRATLDYKASPITLRDRKLQLEGNRIVHSTREADVASDGSFALSGLEPGLTYQLVALDSADRGSYQSQGSVGMQVRAPASNIHLDWPLVKVTFRIVAQGAPVTNAQLRSMIPAEGAWAGVPIHYRGGWQSPTRSNREGLATVILPKGSTTHFEVSAPGLESRMVEVNTETLPPSGEVVVELGSGPDSATLAIHFTQIPPKALEGAMVIFYVFDQDRGLQQFGPASIASGVAKIHELPAGTKKGNLNFFMLPTNSYHQLPFFEDTSRKFGFAALQPGEQRVHELPITVGGRIQLQVTGCVPGVAPPIFELVDPAGQTRKPKSWAPNASGGAEETNWSTDGPGLLGKWLAPGTYAIRQVSPAYQPEELTAHVLAGQVTDVHLHLRPR